MKILLTLLIIAAVIVFTIIVIYNRLVALRQKRNNAFSDIEVQLKLRFDLVPQLVETVKGYMTHEKELLENVTQARASVGKSGAGLGDGRLEAEGALGSALMNLLAVAENYPDLKANQNFQVLMDELSDIENKIAAARRFFNNITSELNTSVQQFPAVLIAGTFGFHSEEFFEVPEDQKEAINTAPDVKFGS